MWVNEEVVPHGGIFSNLEEVVPHSGILLNQPGAGEEVVPHSGMSSVVCG